MLNRRTAQMVEFEDASRALEKAKPNKKEAVRFVSNQY